ncbi:hypothetical protein LNO81_30850 [Klebsiella variicola subsp. variicola]|nr:hypothetical protein [Klebsiella variicola subsp. variicola]
MGLNAMPFMLQWAGFQPFLRIMGFHLKKPELYTGILQFTTAIPGLMLAATLRRLEGPENGGCCCQLLSGISLIGILYAPGLSMLWAALLGFGCGASMMLGLTFVGLRTTNAGDAAALSGMAQCVGYLMAAMGPLLLGKVHDWYGGWTVPLLMTAVITVAGALTGLAAGRDVYLQPATSAD